MAKVFVSYARASSQITNALVTDVEALGHRAWFDQELTGGQAWWDQILVEIRNADVLIFILDPASIESVACKRESDYAAALGKPILPVLVAEGVSTNLLPRHLSELQFVDFRKADRQSLTGLARSLGALPPSRPLPNPLPPPPMVPASYLSGLASRVNIDSAMTFEEQSTLVVELRQGLREAANRNDSLVLLRRLRARRDLLATVAENIDELLRQGTGAEQQKAPTPIPEVAPAEVPPAKVTTSKSAGRVVPAIAGAALGAVVALSGLLTMPRLDSGAFFLFMLVGGVAGAITGAITGRERSAITVALLCTVAGIAIGLIFTLANNFHGDAFAAAVVVGAPSGAILGAIAHVIVRRRKAAQRSDAIGPAQPSVRPGS